MIPCISPGLSESQIHIVQNAWKNFLQIVNHVSSFFSDARLNAVYFAGPPEPFEGHLDFLPNSFLLLACPHLVFALNHQAVECPMLFEDSESLCLRWMSCQHWLNPDLIQLRRHQ